MKPEDFTKIKIEGVCKTPTTSGPWELIADRFWAVTEDDSILLYKGRSRQCNPNKEIVDKIISGAEHPGVKVVYLDRVWFKHNCSDYC
jgi:hypothetical protein